MATRGLCVAGYAVAGQAGADRNNILNTLNKEWVMAKPVDFVVGQQNLVASKERTLEGAAREHADAVLSAYELLEEARREQVLDLLRGAIGAKAEIMSALADFGSKPASVNAARNLISVAKVVGEIDPELVTKASTN